MLPGMVVRAAVGPCEFDGGWTSCDRYRASRNERFSPFSHDLETHEQVHSVGC
jgi:hypothetical protein